MSEWAASHRVLTSEESAQPGNWRNENAPYAVDVMNAFCDLDIEIIVWCKGTQVAGSESKRNMIGYALTHAPGPIIVVNPNQAASEEELRDRIRPMLFNTPVLAEKLRSGAKRGITRQAIRLRHMTVYLGWAGSAQALAARPCRYAFLDEIDKWPERMVREAPPLKLAEERTKTFIRIGRKIVIISTPTVREGRIYRELESCTVRKSFHCPCPHCGEFQVLKFDNIKFPDKATPDEIKLGRLASYSCSSCKRDIGEIHKSAMVRGGRWLADGFQKIDRLGVITGTAPRAVKVGFHCSSLVSMSLGWSDIAAEYVRCRHDADDMQNFFNGWLAEPYEQEIKRVDVTLLQKRVATSPPPGTVPEWALALFSTVDTQKDSFWYVIRAWGAGNRSALLRYGKVGAFNEVYHNCLLTPFDFRGQSVYPALLAIDSGGGMNPETDTSRTQEVYGFVALNPAQIIPLKGSSADSPFSPVKSSNVEYRIRDNSGIRGHEVGLQIVDTQFMKDRLARHMSIKPGEPGEWLLHNAVCNVYLRQLQAERKVRMRGSRREKWVAKYRGIDNHLFDCEVMQMVLAYMCRMHRPSDIDVQQFAPTAAANVPVQSGVQVANREYDTFMTDGRGSRDGNDFLGDLKGFSL